MSSLLCLLSTGSELDSLRAQAGQVFFDIPKFQAEDSLTAQSLRTAFKDKTAFMIQCYVSSLCNSDTRAVIPPSHCTCNNDRYRRTSQFLFRLKTRVLTQGVPDTICVRKQAGKVSVVVLFSSMRNENNKALLDRLLNFPVWRFQDVRCEHADSSAGGTFHQES